MDNSGFRELLSKREDKTPAESSGLSAEERAAKKAAKKEAFERRMAIQKRREEALAEANKYTDRAAERRQEEAKQGGVAPMVFDDDGEEQAQSVSSAPTFAQLGDRFGQAADRGAVGEPPAKAEDEHRGKALHVRVAGRARCGAGRESAGGAQAGHEHRADQALELGARR